MMRNLFSLSLLVAAGAVVGCLANEARADAIAVANPSFEAEGLSSGGWSDAITDWNEDNEDTNGSFAEVIDGFNAGDGGTHHLGINALQTTIDAGLVPPGTIIYNVWQDLGVELQPNTEYTLTVAVGNRNASFTVPGNLSVFALEAGGVTYAIDTFDASTIPASTFVDVSTSFITGDTAPDGTLTVKLANAGAGRSHFDNVRVDATLIPEPAGAMLLISGLLAGLGLARRRR